MFRSAALAQDRSLVTHYGRVDSRGKGCQQEAKEAMAGRRRERGTRAEGAGQGRGWIKSRPGSEREGRIRTADFGDTARDIIGGEGGQHTVVECGRRYDWEGTGKRGSEGEGKPPRRGSRGKCGVHTLGEAFGARECETVLNVMEDTPENYGAGTAGWLSNTASNGVVAIGDQVLGRS